MPTFVFFLYLWAVSYILFRTFAENLTSHPVFDFLIFIWDILVIYSLVIVTCFPRLLTPPPKKKLQLISHRRNFCSSVSSLYIFSRKFSNKSYFLLAEPNEYPRSTRWGNRSHHFTTETVTDNRILY